MGGSSGRDHPQRKMRQKGTRIQIEEGHQSVNLTIYGGLMTISRGGPHLVSSYNTITTSYPFTYIQQPVRQVKLPTTQTQSPTSHQNQRHPGSVIRDEAASKATSNFRRNDFTDQAGWIYRPCVGFGDASTFPWLGSRPEKHPYRAHERMDSKANPCGQACLSCQEGCTTTMTPFSCPDIHAGVEKFVSPGTSPRPSQSQVDSYSRTVKCCLLMNKSNQDTCGKPGLDQYQSISSVIGVTEP
jgi:hypothetical protein